MMSLILMTTLLTASPEVEKAQANVVQARAALKAIRTKERLAKADDAIVKAQARKAKLQESLATK